MRIQPSTWQIFWINRRLKSWCCFWQILSLHIALPHVFMPVFVELNAIDIDLNSSDLTLWVLECDDSNTTIFVKIHAFYIATTSCLFAFEHDFNHIFTHAGWYSGYRDVFTDVLVNWYIVSLIPRETMLSLIVKKKPESTPFGRNSHNFKKCDQCGFMSGQWILC